MLYEPVYHIFLARDCLSQFTTRDRNCDTCRHANFSDTPIFKEVASFIEYTLNAAPVSLCEEGRVLASWKALVNFICNTIFVRLCASRRSFDSVPSHLPGVRGSEYIPGPKRWLY